MIGLEILVMCTRCCKRLIAYHKANGIIILKKHVKVEDKVIYEKYSKDATT
jgi:hypothetical protein